MLLNQCTGVNRCGNARTCARCARLRQAKIATAAEALEREHGQLTLTTLVPNLNTAEEIKRLRASFLRRQIAQAGLWTIETGSQFAGLHINILSTKPAMAKFKQAVTYSELVRCTSREAAAYISKQSGMPPVEQYAGNLYGTFGQLFIYMINNRAYPVVQAAAIETTLAGATGKQIQKETQAMKSTPSNDPNNWVCRNDLYDHSKPLGYMPNDPEHSNPPWFRKTLSKETRLEIMHRHLPNIYAALGKKTE